jgi:hypothetical protein
LFSAGGAFILGQGPLIAEKREAARFFGYFFDLKQKSNGKLTYKKYNPFFQRKEND